MNMDRIRDDDHTGWGKSRTDFDQAERRRRRELDRLRRAWHVQNLRNESRSERRRDERGWFMPTELPEIGEMFVTGSGQRAYASYRETGRITLPYVSILGREAR